MHKRMLEGLQVQVINGQFEKALRIFTKKIQNDGKLKELREREFYEKPSIRRKHAKMAAKRRESKRASDSGPQKTIE